VIVLSYFDTDWYVQQMTRPVNESPALDFTLDYNNYKKGTNDILYVTERLEAISLREYLKLLKNESELLKLKSQFSSAINSVPSRNLVLEIDEEKVLNSGIIPDDMKDLVIPQLNLRVKGNYMTKGTMMLMDLIATSEWERPIYFNNTSLATIGFDLRDHVVMEGLTYRLLPVQKPENVDELVNTDMAYKNVMEEFAFRGMDNPDNYFDDEYRRFTSNHRSALNSLTIALLEEEKTEMAAEIQKLSLEKFPNEAIPYDLASGQSVPLLFELGEDELALDIVDKMATRSVEMLEFYETTDRALDREASISIEMLRYFVPLLKERGYEEQATQIQKNMERIFGPTGNLQLNRN